MNRHLYCSDEDFAQRRSTPLAVRVDRIIAGKCPCHGEGQADETVDITVECDGLIEYVEHGVAADEHGIYAALSRMIPWFTGHKKEYAAGIIEQSVFAGETTFTVPTEAHGPVKFTIVS